MKLALLLAELLPEKAEASARIFKHEACQKAFATAQTEIQHLLSFTCNLQLMVSHSQID
jgi:hypothetical protein